MTLRSDPLEGVVPRALLIQVPGEGRLGPEDHVGPVLRPNSAREVKQLGDHAVRWALPLFVECLVGLDHADEADVARRQRAHPPGAVSPREDDRRQHERQPPYHVRPSDCPTVRRQREHHIAPRQPARHAARAGEIGPLHQHRRVGERGPEPEPGEPDVAQVADEPLQRRPREREHEGERHRRHRQAHAHDEPEQQPVQQAQHRDGREVAQRGECGEVPQGDDHPVQHQPVGRHAVPEAEPERTARVAGGGGVEQQEDGGSDGDETQRRNAERRVAREQRERAQGDQRSRAAAAHRITSRPSSAERYTASTTRCSAS